MSRSVSRLYVVSADAFVQKKPLKKNTNTNKLHNLRGATTMAIRHGHAILKGVINIRLVTCPDKWSKSWPILDVTRHFLQSLAINHRHKQCIYTVYVRNVKGLDMFCGISSYHQTSLFFHAYINLCMSPVHTHLRAEAVAADTGNG